MTVVRAVLMDGDDGVEWRLVGEGAPRPFTLMEMGWASSQQTASLRGLETPKQMPGWKKRPFDPGEPIEYEEGKEYTPKELEQLADQLLRAHANSVDPDTGKKRGIGGEDPILFAQHLYERQKREILNENGVPEPSLVQGMYYRTHPEGRKVNSEEQRKKHGAAFYR